MSEKTNKITMLVRAARENARFWRSLDDQPFADIQEGSSTTTVPLISPEFSSWLFRLYHSRAGNYSTKSLISDVIANLNAEILASAERHPVYMRTARIGSTLYVNLGSGRFLHVTPSGWAIKPTCPVRFYKPSTLMDLPNPQPGQSIELLRKYLPTLSERDWVFAIGWLIGAYTCENEYPILQIKGPYGSAKTTTLEFMRSLIDPADALHTNKLTEIRDLLALSTNNHVLAYDNLQHIEDDISDALCTISTGGAIQQRKLYTDDGVAGRRISRPIILSGIADVSSMPDLKNRTLSVELKIISPSERRNKEFMLEEFHRDLPYILGALFSIISSALSSYHTIQMPVLPRLARVATLVTASESALNWEPHTFLKHYTASEEEQIDGVIENSSVAQSLIRYFEHYPGSFIQGTTNEIMNTLAPHAPPHNWPKNPRHFRSILDLILPTLNTKNIVLRKGPRTSKGRTFVLAHLTPRHE